MVNCEPVTVELLLVESVTAESVAVRLNQSAALNSTVNSDNRIYNKLPTTFSEIPYIANATRL
jgi:hypothetical protein